METLLISAVDARFAYWMTTLLLLIGFYGIIAKRNLVKKLIGLNIIQSAIILFFISLSAKRGGTVPIVPHHGPESETLIYASPLPHVLMLTAIVVMVATAGVALALVIQIYRRYGALDEGLLLGRGR